MNQIGQKFKNISYNFKKSGFLRTLLLYISAVVKYPRMVSGWKKLTHLLPIGKILVFECENDMQDNSRALYEYLCANGYNEKYRMVWIVRDLEYCQLHFARNNVRFVSRLDSDIYEKFRFLYYLARARYFFFTHPYWLQQWRKDQTVIHLGHGAAPIKAGSGQDMSNCFDYMLTASHFVIPWQLAFWGGTEKHILIMGAPRNDWLYSGSRKKSIAPFFDIKNGEKIIAVLPTFRQTKNWIDSDVVDRFSMSVVSTDEQMEQLNSLLVQNKIHILVKIHPLQRLDCIEQKNLSNIHYLENNALFHQDVQLNEILCCCDALATDFSSVYFDFLQLDRPMAFFINATDDYHRGYMMDNPLDYMPGEKVSNFTELLAFVQQVASGIDPWQTQRKQLNDLINQYQDSNNAQRLAEYLKL